MWTQIKSLFLDRTRHLRPGEVEPQPIERALPSHVIKTSSSQKAESGQSQDELTDGDTDGEEKLLRSTSPSPHEIIKEVGRSFVLSCNLIPWAKTN